MFCQEQGVGDHCFYYWRKRLQKSEVVQFALLKTLASAAPLELILAKKLCVLNGFSEIAGMPGEPGTVPTF